MKQLRHRYNNPISCYLHLKDDKHVDIVLNKNRNFHGSSSMSLASSVIREMNLTIDNCYVFHTPSQIERLRGNMRSNSNLMFAHLGRDNDDREFDFLVQTARNVEVFIPGDVVAYNDNVIMNKANTIHLSKNVCLTKSVVALNIKKTMLENFQEYGGLEINDYVDDKVLQYSVEDLLPHHRNRVCSYEDFGKLMLEDHPISKILKSDGWRKLLNRPIMNAERMKSMLKHSSDPMGEIIASSKTSSAITRKLDAYTIAQTSDGGDVLWHTSFDDDTLSILFSSLDYSKPKDAVLDIESSGGSPDGVMSMFSLMQRLGIRTIRCNKYAASMGAIALFLFDKCEVAVSAKIMMHCGAIGNSTSSNSVLDSRAMEFFSRHMEAINKVFHDFFLDSRRQADYDSQNDIWMSGMQFVAHFRDDSGITAIGHLGVPMLPSECRKGLRMDIPEEDLKTLDVYRERLKEVLSMGHKELMEK